MLFFCCAAMAKTQNVGIGTTTPIAKLHVVGGVLISDSINIGGQVRITSGSPGAGKVLTSDANGVGSWAASSGNGCSYSIGQNVPALGGFIFYLDISGCHGLVCAPTDQSSGIQWYNGSAIITNSIESGIGMGKGNTQSIIKFQGAGSYAASVCATYTGGAFSDWYLPSRYELNLMWFNVGQGSTNVGGFANALYWSSTENVNASLASYHIFSNGSQGTTTKSTLYYVRAVRAF